MTDRTYILVVLGFWLVLGCTDQSPPPQEESARKGGSVVIDDMNQNHSLGGTTGILAGITATPETPRAGAVAGEAPSGGKSQDGGQSGSGADAGGLEGPDNGGNTMAGNIAGMNGGFSVPLAGQPVMAMGLCDSNYPENTIGIQLCRPEMSEGYTLFHPIGGLTTYLIDELGRVVHEWPATFRPGLAVELLPDGRLVRTQNLGRMPIQAGGAAGGIEIVDWDGNIEWSYRYNDERHRSHHDFEVLPNGNILLISWVVHPRNDVIAAGKNPAQIPENGQIWSDEIIELLPMGRNDAQIVWRWRAWDHLVQSFDEAAPHFGVASQSPHRIDVNTGRGDSDWLHINSVDYHPELDLILLSVRGLSEIWIIDHSTTTAEAATGAGGRFGRGGDLLYRWGNPSMYGVQGARQLFAQHDAHWIADGRPGAGNILIFNNGVQMGDRRFSSVDEMIVPMPTEMGFSREPDGSYGPQQPHWTYTDNPAFYSRNISGAQRLPNGNTLICEGASGRLFEVTQAGDLVWEYINPIVGGNALEQGTEINANRPRNGVFRALRYPRDYPAFQGRDLTASEPIEGN